MMALPCSFLRDETEPVLAAAHAERERWEAATAGFRRFHADEVIALCRSNEIRPSEVAWLTATRFAN